MSSKPHRSTPLNPWRDDIATPVEEARLADLLADPRDTFSRPDRLSRHLCLSSDEKRLALCAWLVGVLAEGRRAADADPSVAPALAELTVYDPAAAAVFRRALRAIGLASLT